MPVNAMLDLASQFINDPVRSYGCMIDGVPFPPAHAAADPAPLVCVVDHDEASRAGLERLFRCCRLPVRTFSSATNYLAQSPHPGPCCLVTETSLPELDGFRLQEIIASGSVRIVFLTASGDVSQCARAMKAGAVDFLTKPANDEILLAAVAAALDQSRLALAEIAEREKARKKLSRLTPRESAVMCGVIEGMLNKQIAAELHIAEKTVKVHRGRMMRKAGVVCVPDLLRLAQTAGDIGFTETWHHS